MKQFAIGADIGGSHITCQRMDMQKNRPVEGSEVRIPVDSQAPEDEILEKWSESLKKAAGPAGFGSMGGIGFAMPGPFDYRKGIALFRDVHKFDHLYGINIREALRKKLGLPDQFPIRFFNDASCFAIGEAWLGEASRYERIIALTLGTGFGTTFIKKGFPVAGIDGIPEDGFLYREPFQESVADDYFSTRWFIKQYREKTGKQISGVKELVENRNTDPVAGELFQNFGANLGTFLAPWIARFKAECIVMGGNISKSHFLFQNEMKKFMGKNGENIKIYPSGLDETAALFGSAKLCENEFYNHLTKTNILK